MKLKQNTRNIVLDTFIIAVVLIIIFMLHDSIKNVIAPFIYALVVSYLLNPMVNFLERKKIKRAYGIVIIFLGLISLISLIFMTLIPKITNEIAIFASELPNIFDFLNTTVTKLKTAQIPIIPEAIFELIDFDSEIEKITQAFTGSFKQISSFLISSTNVLLNIVMTPIISFYFLKDKKKMLNFISKGFNSKKHILKNIFIDIDNVLGGFIRGQMIVASFVGILTGIGCYFIGVPYAITVGLVAGVTNVVPYFGPWIGGILPVILALMNNPITALWVAILIVVIQQVEASFISPQIMAHSVGLHPVTIIFSILLFGNAFGIIGMIIGVPLTGVIKVLSKHVFEFRDNYRVKKYTL